MGGGNVKYLLALFIGWVAGGATLIAILLRGEKYK